MELIFLGTGAGVPSKERNVSAIALDLLQEENSIWLFDCGESTQQQILHTSIKPRKITKIFITHLHGDHIFGLPGLLSSRSFQGGDELLTVYGPAGIRAYVETSLKTSGTRLSYPLSVIEISEGQIMEEGNFRIAAGKLDHGIPSYGYRVEEKDRPGELLVERLKEKGIMPGPVYRQIKENSVTITPEGERIYRKDVIGPNKKGRVLSILGDTRFSPAHTSLARDANVLVHEATFGKEKSELARDYFHSTTVQAAELARKSNAARLVLTHISSRYQKEDHQQLLAEACAIFPNTELANDFHRISINHQT